MAMEKEKKEISQLVKEHDKIATLLHYCNKDTLKEIHTRQVKGKASGIDKVTKEKYEENLEENLETLITKMKTFSYHPYPVRRVEIPKGNGKTRPLGIPTYEDRLVQGVFKEVLEGVYEPKFLNNSYGFRAKRSCHDAVKDVNLTIMTKKVNYILDCDIKGFFDNITHEWMMRFLEHDIKDKKFLRYINRFLIGGVMVNGEVLDTDKGTPQGGLISPVLANVYLHYVLDTWYEVVKKTFKGYSRLVRYCDDFVVMFQYEKEAQEFYQKLIERLRKFGLEIEENKTRIIPYGMFKGSKESFDFLGFTFINGKTATGKYRVIMQTSKKKLRGKKEAVSKWLKKNIHIGIAEMVKKVNVKLNGHYRYYGIFSNYNGLCKFQRYVKTKMWKTLRRQGQRTSWLTLSKFDAILESLNFAKPKIYITSAY